MASDTFSSILGWLQMQTGNDLNTWGVNHNSNVSQIFENAIAGQLSQTVTGGTLDLSTTPPPAAPSQVGYAILNFSGGLTATQIVKVPNLTMRWIVFNNTTGAFALQLQTPTGTPITIPQGSAFQVWCDGNNNLRQVTAGSVLSIAQFGGTPDGATDNTAALNAAFAALPKTGGAIYFPAGKYAFASSITLQLPSANAVYDLTIYGDGPDATVLYWVAGGGMDVVYNSNSVTINNQGTHFRDLAFTTGASGAGTALTLSQSGNNNGPLAAQTEISRCSFRGDAPYSNYWGNDLNLIGISNVNVIGCAFAGPGTQGGAGVLYSGLNGTNLAAILNVSKCSFGLKASGISVGSYAQIVGVEQCTFTNCVTGVSATGTGLAELAISDCRFTMASNSNGVACQSAFNLVKITNSSFVVQAAATVTTGILLSPASNFAISNCIFLAPTGLSNNFGISVLNQTTSTGGVILGNLFAGMSVGINCGGGSANVSVGINQFISCTSPVINSASSGFGLWRNDTTAGNLAALIQNGTGQTTCNGLGIRAGVNAAADANTVLISLASGDGSNIVGSVTRSGPGVVYGTTSDERLKTEFRPTARGLDTLLRIPIEDFVWKNDPERRVVQGIVAQRLLPHCPEAINVGGDDPSTEPWTADYGRLTPLLIRAVQELSQRVADLERGRA